MWVSAQRKDLREAESPVVGEITGTINEKAVLQCAGEYRDVPVLAPGGIAWVPRNGAQGVLLPLFNGAVCAGVPVEDKGLEPGELMLFSAGGASIVLKNSGEVLVNGCSVTGVKEAE